MLGKIFAAGSYREPSHSHSPGSVPVPASPAPGAVPCGASAAATPAPRWPPPRCRTPAPPWPGPVHTMVIQSELRDHTSTPVLSFLSQSGTQARHSTLREQSLRRKTQGHQLVAFTLARPQLHNHSGVRAGGRQTGWRSPAGRRWRSPWRYCLCAAACAAHRPGISASHHAALPFVCVSTLRLLSESACTRKLGLSTHHRQK